MRKRNLFALVELFIMKNCKIYASIETCAELREYWKGIVLPCLTSSFKCFNVPLFKCFPVPSSFPVLCSRFFLRRVKMKIFTLIELLITNTCQIYIYSKG